LPSIAQELIILPVKNILQFQEAVSTFSKTPSHSSLITKTPDLEQGVSHTRTVLHNRSWYFDIASAWEEGFWSTIFWRVVLLYQQRLEQVSKG